VFKLIETLYRLANIKRYSVHRVNQQQNVATHSFYVTTFSMLIADCDAPLCNKELVLRKAHMHDWPEAIFGDVASPTKHYNKELSALFKEVEKDAIENLCKSLPIPQNYADVMRNAKSPTIEGEIVSLADLLERLIYLKMEIDSGNKVAFDMWSDTLKNLKSPHFVKLLKKYPTAKKLFLNYFKQIKKAN